MQEKGFISTIFDFSFSEFVTTKVIKFLLGLAVIANAVITIAAIIGAFSNSVLGGIIVLIISPLIFLLLMLMSRIYLELIIVIFRIAENLIAIRDGLGSRPPEGGESGSSAA